MNSQPLRILRWTAALVLFSLCCWSLLAAFYHWWASSFPDSGPVWHRHWGNWFFALALVAFVALIVIVWVFRPSAQKD
jgi:hypothetical protein